MMQICDDGFVILFGHSNYLWVVCGAHEVLHTKERSKRFGELPDELWVFIFEQKVWNSVLQDPMTDAYRHSLC